MLLNGSTIVKKYKNKLIKKFKKLNNKAKLAIIVLNGLENQKDFLNFKKKFADSLGVEVVIYDWSHLNTNECLVKMNELSQDKSINGIIPQLPANKNIDINILLENIPILKDVDGLNPKQFNKKHPFVGASNVTIVKLVNKYNFFRNKRVLLIGRNKYFAEPLKKILINKKHSVDMIKSSDFFPWMIRAYDIIISTVNKPLFINTALMKKNSIAIDLTYFKNADNEKPVGAFYGINNHLKLFTPVPGGLGPLTILNLFNNLYKLTKKHCIV